MKNIAAGRTEEAKAVWRRYIIHMLLGLLCAIGFTFIALLAFAAVLFFGNIGDAFAVPAVTVLALLALFFSAKYAARGCTGSGVAFGAALGALYYIFCYILSCFLFSQFSFSLRTAVFMLICVLTGCIGGVVGRRTPEKTAKKRKKKR